MFTVVMAALLVQAIQPPASTAAPTPVADVRQLVIGQPATLAEIDTNKVQGNPVGLACNADGTIYLRVRQGKDKTRHYQIATRPSLSVGQSEGAPEWAAAYWTWKSSTMAPGDPTLKLDVEQRKDRTRAVNSSSGADIAGMSSSALTGGGGGDSMSEAVVWGAAMNAIDANVVTLKFKGQVVGEWVNEPPVPGMKLGWAPAPMTLLAWTDAEGGLHVSDREGRHVKVAGTKNVILPAWSTDGKQLLFLQKKGSSQFTLMVAAVR